MQMETCLATPSISGLLSNKEARTMAETYTASDHFVNKDPSAKRFHHKVRISSPKDLEEELKTWLEEAYALSE
jgi:hypothetical protein